VAGIDATAKEAAFSVQPRMQLAAIAELRWRLFANALRTRRGKLELVSRVLISFAFAIGGLGGSFVMAAATFFFISEGKPGMIAVLMWPIFFFWQAFPIMATAFTSNPDSSDLLRFPLGYRSYFLVRMAYGAIDASTALVGLWCLGILTGVVLTKPILFPWAVLVLLTFATFNIFLNQMIFAWVERWLAQRRIREVMGVFFVLLMLSFQLIGPLLGHFGRQTHPEAQRVFEIVASVQAILPPGLAADAIAQGIYSQIPVAFSSFALLCGFVLITSYFLHMRLRAQYRGENLTEVAAVAAVPQNRALPLGWNIPGLGSPVAAVIEKEFRYLLRSGPMLLTLIMPIFVLLIFRLGAMNPARRTSGFLQRTPDMAFPVAVAYTLLMLTNLIYNNFGGDAGGIQFFYAAPVRFKEIVLGKNLTHAAILIAETFVAYLAVSFLYGPPSIEITLATLAALLFAAPVNFSAGNLLSIYSAKKLDYSKFGRQRASPMTGLLSLIVQVAIVGIAASAFFTARHYGKVWVATIFLLVLSGISFWLYGIVLSRIDQFALERREELMAELCRA